jgi:hypothetical protein
MKKFIEIKYSYNPSENILRSISILQLYDKSVIGSDKHALRLKLSMKIVMLFVDVIVMLSENIIVIM